MNVMVDWQQQSGSADSPDEFVTVYIRGPGDIEE